MGGETAHRTAASPSLPAFGRRKQGPGDKSSPRVRSRLTGLLSRRNTASHRCSPGPGTGRSPSARSRPKAGAPALPPSLFETWSLQSKRGHPMGAPVHLLPGRAGLLPTVALPTSGERVEAMSASSQPAPASSPVLCPHYAPSGPPLSRGSSAPLPKISINSSPVMVSWS